MRFSKKLKIFSVGSLILGMGMLLSFSGRETYSATAQKINSEYISGFKSFIQEVRSLKEIAARDKDSLKLEDLQSQLLTTRERYKEIEYLFAYSAGDFVAMNVNGAPLPKIDKQEDAMIRVLEPQGLQILDELIFGQDPLEELGTIYDKIHILGVKLSRILPLQRRLPLTDRQIFEAYRQEIIRIFTLGVSGFDTPLSGNSMPEALAALRSLELSAQHYYPFLEEKAPTVGQELKTTLTGAISFIEENPGFDTFDRMAFLKDYINPLYKSFLDAQMALNIETIYEITSLPQAINYYTENLFDQDFINANYFLKYESGEDVAERIELGKMLFFDPVLSSNNERSCASCHQPGKAFTDGMKKSIALNFEGTIKRNSPTLINSVFAERYFHDLRAEQLEAQMEHVIVDDKEFNSSFTEVLSKLAQSEEYQERFKEAFPHMGKSTISLSSLTYALSAYVKSLQGLNSRADKYIRGEDSTALNESEIRGFNLFMGKAACGTCHFAPIFNGSVPVRYIESESEVLGVPATTDTVNPEIDPDLGRYASGRFKEQSEIYMHSFKTPTVRNIALTAPYMHNGVYETLEEVMDFYNKGGGTGLGIEVPNQTLPFDSLGLNQMEIQDIISFMEALTDTTGLTSIPTSLPAFPEDMGINDRVIGGKY